LFTLTVKSQDIRDKYNIALRDRFNRFLYPALTLLIISFITMLMIDLHLGDFKRMTSQFWFVPQILFIFIWVIAKRLGSLWAPYSIFVPIFCGFMIHYLSMQDILSQRKFFDLGE
jgi:hypothetical protein